MPQSYSSAASATAASSVNDRTTAQDTVTISSAGQALSHASSDGDSDGS